MTLLHPLTDYGDPIALTLATAQDHAGHSPAYWYEGRCPQTDDWLRLPRTRLAETIARGLMQRFMQIAQDSTQDSLFDNEGKMYGILVVETPSGERRVLQAFSGLLNGNAVVDEWVPPIAGRDQVAAVETQTLVHLTALKQQLMTLQDLPERQQYESLSQQFATQLQDLATLHQHRKAERQRDRQTLLQTLSGTELATALEQLDEQSRRDGLERRRLKREREAVLQPLQQILIEVDRQIQTLKQQRRDLSRQLQTQMHAAYHLVNFWGMSHSLRQLLPDGLPSGTGDCCAPKLLHYAATHDLTPLGMAEFWWGSATGDKIPGHFYGACSDRCQPLLGFLLSGLSGLTPPTESNPSDRPSPGSIDLPLLYQDEDLIAVNKPAGLLSVPGRTLDRQDSVLSRLRSVWPEVRVVHRLDQDTSGILLCARDLSAYRQVSQQFQQRQVCKVYEAILAGPISRDRGRIELPLWSDPDDRPRQTVDWQRGKPSQTQFQVLSQTPTTTRLEFIPLTGRTHQLRVHAAHPNGLSTPILGDRLYGNPHTADRLHLHAKTLTFQQPRSGQQIVVQSPVPF